MIFSTPSYARKKPPNAKMIFMAMGKNVFSNKAIGTIINLLMNEPLVIAHNTGSSLDETNPVDFSAFTAKSSPKIPAVFLVATFAVMDTSSINAAISSKIAKKLKQDIPKLYYWDNNKIHLGDLKNFSMNAVYDTLVDFFIMSKSKQINIINYSGFSKIISLIYDIKYQNI